MNVKMTFLSIFSSFYLQKINSSIINRKKWLCSNDSKIELSSNAKNEIEVSDDIINRRLKYTCSKNNLIHLNQPISHELKIRKSNDNETKIWLKKELESLLLDSDVQLLIDAIITINQNKNELKKLLLPFLDEKTDFFVHYFELFLKSGLNNIAFEKWIFFNIKNTSNKF